MRTMMIDFKKLRLCLFYFSQNSKQLKGRRKCENHCQGEENLNL